MNLPFHLAGIQTSILISESCVGLDTAAMRQNSGRSFSEPRMSPPTGPEGGNAAGGLNAPAATVSARVIVASGILDPTKVRHDCAAIAKLLPPISRANAAAAIMMRI